MKTIHQLTALSLAIICLTPTPSQAAQPQALSLRNIEFLGRKFARKEKHLLEKRIENLEDFINGPETVAVEPLDAKQPKPVAAASPWGFSASSETDVNYETNAEGKPHGGSSWGVVESLTAILTFKQPGSAWSFDLEADYIWSRSNEFSKELDADVFHVTPGVTWTPSKLRSFSLTSGMEWAMKPGLGTEIYTREHTALGMLQTVKCSDSGRISLTLSPSVDRYWYDQHDASNTTGGLSAKLTISSSPKTPVWQAYVKAGEVYGRYDAGNHYWESTASTGVVWTPCDFFTLEAKVAFTNHAERLHSTDNTYHDFQASPVLTLSHTF